MKRKSLTALGLVVIMLLTGCVVSVSQRYGNLSGYVVIRRNPDASSQIASMGEFGPEELVITAVPRPGEYPLENARVTISGENNREWITNEDGWFHAKNIRVGPKTVTISHQKFRKNLVKQIRIQEGDNSYFEFEGGVGYYLIIGIEKYLMDEFDSAGARNDARKVENVFKYNTRLPLHGPYVLIDSQATKGRIRNTIAELSEWANPEDYLVIYFAGHMGWDFLSPYDDDGVADSNGIPRRAITDTELESWLSRFPGDVTVILDGSESATFANGEETFRAQALSKNKYTVISSALRNQNAGVFEDSLEGVFTYYFVEGLTPRRDGTYPADTERPYGTITAQEIFDYIKSGMWKHVGADQVPELYVGSTENTVILRY